LTRRRFVIILLAAIPVNPATGGTTDMCSKADSPETYVADAAEAGDYPSTFSSRFGGLLPFLLLWI
jgi:hypothetical protein